MADDTSTPTCSDKIEFKKPEPISSSIKLLKKSKLAKEKQSLESKEVENDDESGPNVTLNREPDDLRLSNSPNYKQPKGSGICPNGTDYSLEVLKSGVIVDKLELTKKPYYIFGRQANVCVNLAHPTISRYHAVLQYIASEEEGASPCGWYLHDLGSTHGTFLNGNRVKPHTFVRVRVGHHIKFGTSTRTYILAGPDFDCEGESELTVTEIKKRASEMKLEKQRMMKELMGQKEKERSEAEMKREEQGIDWGMGEDAEDESDLTDNPYASTGNEELFLDDPKKTLRGYFEREGHELLYDCEERGVGQFICRVELPIDDARGRPVVAEVIHKGKKKEAVVACALEACRMLDRAGLLRQAKHESRKKKERDWSADDYYDSDEDTFLDRTGSVEKKRLARMEKHGLIQQESSKALTHQDLTKKVAELEKEIDEEDRKLQRLRADSTGAGDVGEQVDALDAFMSLLGGQGQSMAQKAEISKTKLNIKKLTVELLKFRRLADLAAPSRAPLLMKKALVKQTNAVVYGKRIKLKDDAEKKPKVKQVKVEEKEFVEEMDSDEEREVTVAAVKDKDKRENETESVVTVAAVEDKDKKESETESEAAEVKKEVDTESGEGEGKKRVFGPMRPPEGYVVPEEYFNMETDRDLPEILEKESL